MKSSQEFLNYGESISINAVFLLAQETENTSLTFKDIRYSNFIFLFTIIQCQSTSKNISLYDKIQNYFCPGLVTLDYRWLFSCSLGCIKQTYMPVVDLQSYCTW